MGLRWPGSGWLPGRVAEARLFRDAACVTEGATCFSTVIPSPGTRSYAGACASHQPKRAGSCVQKTALSETQAVPPEGAGEEEQPLSANDRVGNNQWQALANGL